MQEIIKRGDSGGQIEGIGLTGFTRANTDDMRLYAAVEFVSPDYSVKLYKDASRGEDSLVAAGTADSPQATVALDEENESGISGSVKLNFAADDRDIEMLLGYADVSDLEVYEASIDAFLPAGEADFHPQQNEAFFQINQVLRHKLREEAPGCEALLPDAVKDKRSLTRAQVFYVLFLIYNDRAARVDDVDGPYAAAREKYFNLYERELSSITLLIDADSDGVAESLGRPGSAKIKRA
jgi:hypothetical protein